MAACLSLSWGSRITPTRAISIEFNSRNPAHRRLPPKKFSSRTSSDAFATSSRGRMDSYTSQVLTGTAPTSSYASSRSKFGVIQKWNRLNEFYKKGCRETKSASTRDLHHGACSLLYHAPYKWCSSWTIGLWRDVWFLHGC